MGNTVVTISIDENGKLQVSKDPVELRMSGSDTVEWKNACDKPCIVTVEANKHFPPPPITIQDGGSSTVGPGNQLQYKYSVRCGAQTLDPGLVVVP